MAKYSIDELRWWERRAVHGARHLADTYPVPAL